MTLPQSDALAHHWRDIPPPALQLKRIALALGLPSTEAAVHTSAPTPEDALREAMAGGLAVTEGRPDDPLLDFLDL